MKAIIIDNFGDADQLKYKDVPTPIPAENEVLIHVHYASVNPIDWKIREGYMQNMMPHEFPIILGWDASGIIEAVGKNVKNFKVGDAVFAYCRKQTVQWGTYAEYVSIEAIHVAIKPENINFAEAASIPLCALTAWQALYDTCNLKKGQTILILAGSGGVGSIAIQLAHNSGATVLTTASAKNHPYVKKLGADEVIDYTKENVSDKVKQLAPQGIDIVFDCIGGPELRESAKLVKEGGILLSIVDPNLDRLQTAPNVRKAYGFIKPEGTQLTQIADLIRSGKLQTPNITEMPLTDAAKAQQISREGHTQGKLVLKLI